MRQRSTKSHLEAECDYWKDHPENKSFYKTVYGQEGRFVSVLSLLEGVPFRSLLDVGCGHGDFFPYVKTKFPYVEYHGIDIVPKWRSELPPHADFCCGDIFKEKSKHDVIVAIGIFTIAGNNSWSHLQETVCAMWNRADMGIVFTALTKEKPRPYEAVFPFLDLMEFAASLSEKIKLDKCTLPYVNVIGVYR